MTTTPGGKTQELAQIVKDAELGKRLLDKLVQVATHDGGEHWVYVHIEVQGGQEGDFAERLFTYNYRLSDKFRLSSTLVCRRAQYAAHRAIGNRAP
jgi:hypothetical protein